MPTSYNFLFYVMDPGNPPGQNTTLNPQTITVTDNNDDGFIRPGTGDMVGGFQVTAVYVGDTVTIRTGLLGLGRQTITGVTFYRDGAPPVFMATDGTVLTSARFQSSTWVPDSTEYQTGPIPCFTAGTLITTPEGERAVEDLRPGDLVLTRDHGPQMLRWAGSREVVGHGALAPVRFAPGALGNTRALMVSPQHRMVISGWQAELYFGTDEVLAAALHLVNGDTICRVEMPQVRYIHLLFDRHEIVFAEGAATESFHPGARIMAGDAALRSEVLALFPELAQPDGDWLAARQVVRGREAATLRVA